jgi:hypothetical protein
VRIQISLHPSGEVIVLGKGLQVPLRSALTESGDAASPNESIVQVSFHVFDISFWNLSGEKGLSYHSGDGYTSMMTLSRSTKDLSKQVNFFRKWLAKLDLSSIWR